MKVRAVCRRAGSRQRTGGKKANLRCDTGLMQKETHRPPSLRWALGLAACLLLTVAGQAASMVTPKQQADLDAAVAAYKRGRLVEARQRLRPLAAQGVPAAQFNLAVMHLRGELVPADVQQAQRLLEQSAAGGFVTAMFFLGQAFEAGQFGKPDLPVSYRWYLLAANAGSVPAQVAVATAHYLGRGAVKDAALAARWYREAAKGGDVGAQYLLASMYEQGDGVPLDLRLARDWYEAAAGQGDEAAPGKVKELDARLAATRTTARP